MMTEGLVSFGNSCCGFLPSLWRFVCCHRRWGPRHVNRGPRRCQGVHCWLGDPVTSAHWGCGGQLASQRSCSFERLLNGSPSCAQDCPGRGPDGHLHAALLPLLPRGLFSLRAPMGMFYKNPSTTQDAARLWAPRAFLSAPSQRVAAGAAAGAPSIEGW